ncbi:UrcA family protein [Hyphobacterium sp.]|jgi:UrcA family protein|uniref:UrcA family protein n=1 Tax=Hyphobacterium sp. TaxID=2004662 RepID=UPI003BAD0AAD
MKKTILALAAGGLLAAPAFGTSDMFRFEAQASELQDTRSVALLYERLDAAVLEYCVELVDEPQVVTCHTEVLASVVEQFDNANLTSLHLQATSSVDGVSPAAGESGV